MNAPMLKMILVALAASLTFSLVFDTSDGVWVMWALGGDPAMVGFAATLLVLTWVIGSEDFFYGRDRPLHRQWAALSVSMMILSFQLTKASVIGHRPELFLALSIVCCAVAINEVTAQRSRGGPEC